MQTKVSTRGQVVIPKDVRERLKFDIGTQLEVVVENDAVIFRKVGAQKSKSFEECEAQIRAAVSYSGPRGDAVKWQNAIALMFTENKDRQGK